MLVFWNTTAHANADALSRLLLLEEPVKTVEEPELVLLAEHLADSPVTAVDIQSWTRRDKKLSKVLQYVQHGWPNEGDPDLEPYSSCCLELSSHVGNSNCHSTTRKAGCTTEITRRASWNYQNESSCQDVHVVAKDQHRH